MPSPPAYLLDTNILIHYARASVAGKAVEARFHFQASPFKPMVCIVTVGEVFSFAKQNGWGTEKRERLQEILDRLVCIDIDPPEVLHAYAGIHSYVVKHGGNIGDNDLWIAATAKVTGATLLTADKDFERLEPGCIPWIYVDPHTGDISTRSGT